MHLSGLRLHDAAIQASTSQPLSSTSSQTAAIPVCHNYPQHIEALDPAFKTSLFTGLLNAQAEQENAVYKYSPDYHGSAIFKPLRLNDTGYAASVTCGTGNCTFPSYSSLVVRHECSDITHLIHVENGSNSINQTVSLPYPDYYGTSKLEATYSVLQPVHSKFGESSIVYTDLNMTSSGEFLNMLKTPSLGSYGQTFTTDRLFLSDVYGIRYNGVGGKTNESRFSAWHCDLHFAVQHFYSTVNFGVLTEIPGALSSAHWSFKPDPTTRPERAYDDSGYWYLRANIPGKEHKVTIDRAFLWVVAEFLPQYFGGGHKSSGGPTKDEIYNTMVQASSTIGVDKVFASIAKSLTTYFRSATSETVTGSTHALEQYIHVRWEWLLVPVLMVALNTAFVVATALQSYWRGVLAWRTSALAPMMSETSADHGATASSRDVTLLVGPPKRFDRVSDIREWTGTWSAYLRQRAR